MFLCCLIITPYFAASLLPLQHRGKLAKIPYCGGMKGNNCNFNPLYVFPSAIALCVKFSVSVLYTF